MEARAWIPVGPPVAHPLPSYWHDPKSPLANVIEPEPDKATVPYDYAVIGSGISGTLVTFNLLQQDSSARIVMLEAREACGGATGRNGGHTKAASYRTYLQHRRDLGVEEALKIARLEYANIKETHKLAQELDIRCENQLCSTVDIIYDDETFDQGKVAIEQLKADATEEERQNDEMACYSIYEKGESILQQFYVSVKNGNLEVQKIEQPTGAFQYLAGRINAYRFSTSILKVCVRKGLQLCTNTPVHSILQSAEYSTEAPIYDVFTQYNTIQARTVILATNGYTAHLISSLQGVIVPLRGQITVQRPGAATKLPDPLPTTYSFIYRDGYEYMIPRPLPEGGQHMIIGGGLGRQPEDGAGEFGTVDDSSLNPAISKYLRNSLVGYFGAENWGESPEESHSRVVQEWTGIMGATADGRPFVGEMPSQKGIWISAGFNGHGRFWG
ncbi:FAD dependent oxidoreductase [Massariosphaeria phaeospora]|uniref:FAD dependent oxidoreductase n=1 Tax=Massariosphaeria phaeospora TaxID=100035 RepID=A0A7C8I2K8_9PLEO|nr:FAD dependent oxidoreductase [Massariosphaeria phaeospora]